MAQRPALRFAAVILGGMVFLFLAVGTAEFIAVPGPPAVVTFEQAEFVPNSARRPPGDDAAWKTVRLPDEWRKRPAFGGHGWYRIKLDLHRAPEGLQAVFIRNRRSDRITFFVNGKLIGSAREVMSLSAGRAERGFEAPLGFAVPPSMLRPGQNMIHIRMEGSSDPASINGLSRIFYGDARTLRRAQLGINEFNFQARRHTISMALAAGIVTLFLWFARRADRVMFWFCMTCLSWGAVGFLYIKVRWVAPVEITSVMSFYASYGLVVPTLVLSLRTVDLKWPRFEAALWLFFLFELSYPLWPGRPWPAAYLFWSGANTGLLLAAAGIVFYGARRPLEWPIKLQLAALTAMAAFMSFEIARFFGWVDVESPLMRHYHVPIMLFALGAVCFERHARAIRKTAQLNIELEQRVAEKAREIEANHARIGDALRERTLARERQRILADMHDGMGATLVSLLRHVQSGVADPGSIGRRARDALREMRAAIDALQPHGGDLAAVLANLRERLDGLMAGSGVRLVWEVDELPLALALTPFAVFSLQRIVLEAVGNALKHSESSEIHFIVRTRDDGDVEIRIADNGRGFDPARVHAGLG
ncbi:MAG TPA: ATP-binding protein, partial [Burkholderiales bacterium]|nr:ATP-binding protein [Burkholderiales bacterium]